MSLKMISSEALSKYPTSFEEDLEFLENPPIELSFNHRNCVLMRAGEKKVLHFLISSADLFLSLLMCKSSKVSVRWCSGSTQGIQSSQESTRWWAGGLLPISGALTPQERTSSLSIIILLLSLMINLNSLKSNTQWAKDHPFVPAPVLAIHVSSFLILATPSITSRTTRPSSIGRIRLRQDDERLKVLKERSAFLEKCELNSGN